MKRYHLLLLAVASAPLLIHAEPVRKSTAVTDVNAAVPQLSYQSAFTYYKPARDSQTTPDKTWVRANQEVSGQESSDASSGTGTQKNQEKPAVGKPGVVPDADPNKGHNMNMKGH